MRIGPFGIWELVIILVVVLLIFGPKHLPEMAKGVGRSVRMFRKEVRDIKSDLDFTSPEPARTAAAPVTAPAAAPAPAARAAGAGGDAPPPAASWRGARTSMGGLRTRAAHVACTWLAAVATWVGAHSELTSAVPAAGAAHVGAPATLELEFSEPIEARFSVFDLYGLDVGAAWPADPRAPTEAEWARLEVLAGAFAMRTRLTGAPAPGGRHVEALTSRARGATRSIRLPPSAALDPGAYVLVWATVATDGHVMHGHHAFLIVEGP